MISHPVVHSFSLLQPPPLSSIGHYIMPHHPAASIFSFTAVGNSSPSLGLPWALAWHGAGLVPVSQPLARTNLAALGGLSSEYQ